MNTFKSGTPAPQDGFYVFHSYADGSTTPPPPTDQRSKTFTKGQTLPQINGRDVLWELKRS